MKRSKQKGVALIFALIFVLVLSVTAATLMFLSQSETWSSMNYRLMTQSRYGAEAGLHAAANYFMNNYTVPLVGGADPLSAYNVNASPVTLAVGGNPIALGPTMNGISANYPVPTVLTAFNNASQGSLTGGNNTVKYSVSAELLSMRAVYQCGNSQPLTAQLWRLTSHGDITGARNAEVEVSALLESHLTPCYNYAAFATGTGCGAINFTGNGTVDSYDSSNFAAGQQQYDGNLGSNGNLNTANNTNVYGTFSSPDKGVGACGGGAGVDALSGGGNVTGCQTATTGCGTPLVTLPQTVTLLPPTIPNSTPNPSPDETSAVTLAACGVNCPHNGVANGSYGDITMNGNDTVTFVPYVDPATKICSVGTYYINSIKLTGNGTMTVAPCPATSTTPGVYVPVIVNVVGQGNNSPITLTGNGIQNPSMNPAMLQLQYAGNGTVTLTGNGASAACIYAPNALASFTGNGAWWGSIIANKVGSTGNGAMHYDRRLSANLMTVGNWTLDTFTWSKY